MLKRLNNKAKITLATAAVVAAALAGYLTYRQVKRESAYLNFEVVDPGRLLRSAQPRPGDLDQIKAEYGLGTILCLRGKDEDEVREWARQNRVAVVMMEMKADDPPTENQIGLFFDMMRGDTVDLVRRKDAVFRVVTPEGAPADRFEFPVLIHCEGGADRTGVMVALYRLAFMGMSLEQAKKDMISHNHIPPAHPRQFEFLEKMAPAISPDYGAK